VAAYAWNASDYEQHSVAQKQWAAELLDKLALRGHEHVLDMGCGDGLVSAEIAARVPAGGAVGADSSGGMVAHAQAGHPAERYPNLRFVQADARALPFEAAFDAVFSNAVLHWVRDHRTVLAGVRRSLRPGGRLLFQMGGRGNAAEIMRCAADVTQLPAWRDYFQGFVPPYAFYGPDDYEQWLAEAGLTLVRAELIPKDMVHQGAAGVEGWIRTTWQPYTSRVPEADRPRFIADVAARYLEAHPADEAGLAHVGMVRLEVEALKTQ
jgi:trans-aconitate methyltransferase